MTGRPRPGDHGHRPRLEAGEEDTMDEWPRALRSLTGLTLLLALAGCGGTIVASNAGSTIPVILFSPLASTSVFLMSLEGQALHEWKTSFPPGYSVYLLPNGNLLRASSIPERPLS